MLLEEGYCEENAMEQESEECDKIFLYPYTLYGSGNNIVDQIFYAEYCMRDEDGEYEDYKSFWTRMLKK
ncbi:hypothetical protein [Paenibacillus fonticola]|uniref:hypothetical protein n=1 Tax=Paenibacillus fonticola TaxID=379896 RepID=UPI00036EC1EA|nr:hypothetical protein [Paenibacillus fonticola]